VEAAPTDGEPPVRDTLSLIEELSDEEAERLLADRLTNGAA
jgi:hypothetical protein